MNSLVTDLIVMVAFCKCTVVNALNFSDRMELQGGVNNQNYAYMYTHTYQVCEKYTLKTSLFLHFDYSLFTLLFSSIRSSQHSAARYSTSV